MTNLLYSCRHDQRGRPVDEVPAGVRDVDGQCPVCRRETEQAEQDAALETERQWLTRVGREYE